MKIHRIAALSLSLVLAFSLAACGQGASSASSASSSAASSAAAESKTEEQLLAEENEILSANDALWEKVFASMDKNMTETTLSTNYGDFLRSSVEKTKDQFSDEEYKTLTADAEKIRAIEEQIATLALADAAASGAAAQGTAFPQFEGSDLEGNPVDNSLFAGNAFTVVNFWFNGCKPCVEELDDLNALNEKVKAQGGEVVGINTETLDGNQQGIDAAKKLLETTGASYRNIYFASGSEAGKFALNIMAFPTSLYNSLYVTETPSSFPSISSLNKVNFCPSFNSIFLFFPVYNIPVLISGPFISNNNATGTFNSFLNLIISSVFSDCSSQLPCE